jgi:hypothetical protein
MAKRPSTTFLPYLEEAMGTRETYQRILAQACIVAGDETMLAERLHVPVKAVVDWLLGVTPVPTEIFLGAVDIVSTATRKQNEDNRALLAQIRQRHRR